MKTGENVRKISILCFCTTACEQPKHQNITLFQKQNVKVWYIWSIPTALCFKPTVTIVLSSSFVKKRMTEETVSRVRDKNGNVNIGL